MFQTSKRRAQKIAVVGGKMSRVSSKAPTNSPRRTVISRLDPLHDRQKPWAALGAWFLGPKGENGDVFREIVMQTIDSQIQFRNGYFPCDPPYVTDELRDAESFKASMDKLRSEVKSLQKQMQNSVPFYSSRYKGHVNWDTAMPANIGYLCAMLYNPNNCCAESSTVTTPMELEAGTDLCVMMGFDRDISMGHLVSGGSIANIEAIWAARNVKFSPLGLQDALRHDKKLAAAKDYEVFFPQRGKKGKVVNASEWELLNLDIDTILGMPTEVEEVTELEHHDFMDTMGEYLYESIGAQEFGQRHKLTQTACVVIPSSAHISFTKAVTLLGLGKKNLVSVAVDEDARMDIKELKRILDKKLADKIPVVAVVSVMGTTEESAIDRLTEILDMRAELSKKGLNFSIHADAAWGGYFCSMLSDPPEGHHMLADKDSGFVPELCLSTFVHKQLTALQHCDTITIDPHKSGFCPYPAGALCYRDKRMNSFLQITSNVVYYHGDMTLGDIGLEGSKPGAAAAGVMLANRVIGLHKNGYGRILSECMFTAKMMYCVWVTLAYKDDKFVIKTTKPLPKFHNFTEEEQIDLIRKRILGKTNEQLAKDHEAMKYLKEVGPDTMIPCFSVNEKGNDDVERCNEINMALFQSLRHTSSEETARRIPMVVTSSSLLPHKHSSAVPNFKRRLGLDPETDTAVKYIITTCMDPWATSMEFLEEMEAVMRNAILCAIGTATDPLVNHDFVTTGVVNGKDEVISYYVSNFKNQSKQYDTVAKFKFRSSADAKKYASAQEDLLKSGTEPPPIVFRSQESKGLRNLLFDESEYGNESVSFDCFKGMPSDATYFMSADMKIEDVSRYEHFDDRDEYPKASSYFMYGDKSNAFLFHIPTKRRDFLQAVQLDGIPDGVGSAGVEDLLLRYGVEVVLPDVPGWPVIEKGQIVDPLKKRKYDIVFIGVDGEEVVTKVKLGRKIWFDGQLMNSG